MKSLAIWFALSVVVACWSICIDKTSAESPLHLSEEDSIVTDKEDTINPTTSGLRRTDAMAIFQLHSKEVKFIQAQKHCQNLDGDLKEILQLKSFDNATVLSLTNSIGILLSNSSFRWYTSEIALQILQCFSEPSNNLAHCAFYNCPNADSGSFRMSCLYPDCTSCLSMTVVFYVCVKEPSSTAGLSTSHLNTDVSTPAMSSSRVFTTTTEPSSVKLSLLAVSSSQDATSSVLSTEPRTTSMLTTQQFTSVKPSSKISTNREARKDSTSYSSKATESLELSKELRTTRSLNSQTMTSVRVKSSTNLEPSSSKGSSSVVSSNKTTASLELSTERRATRLSVNSQPITGANVEPSYSKVSTLTISRSEAFTSPASTAEAQTTPKGTTEMPATVEPRTKALDMTETSDKDEVARRSILGINVNETDALIKIINITENYVHQTQENVEDTSQSLRTITSVFEQKLTEYALSNLDRHNGTLVIETEEFDILLTEVARARRSRGYLQFPEENRNLDPERNNNSSDFLRIQLDSSLANSSIFVGIIYRTFGQNSIEDVSESVKGKFRQKLVSKIISAEITPKPTGNNTNVTFTLMHRNNNTLGEVQCGFINETRTRNAQTSLFITNGCSVLSTNAFRTTCTCDHMTSFAVFTKIDGVEHNDDGDHRKALTFITYIGIALSFLGETLTVASYVLLIGLKTEQAHLHTNLAFSLGISQIFFVIGLSTSCINEVFCLVISAMIHYFYLVTFCWMLVEGFHLYLMVVKVFNENTYLKLYYMFSWVTPLVIVISALIAAAASPNGIHGYVSDENICWLSAENNYIWFFLGPVLLICVANLTILVMVVREMARMNNTKDGPSLHLRKSLKACLLLFPILGTSWVLGVLLMIKPSLAVEYIFTILNSLQGFMIFLFYVLRSTEIRAVLKQRKLRWTNSQDLTNNASGSYQKTTTVKTTPISVSLVKPILGNWVSSSPQYPPNHRRSPSLQNSLSPHESPSPRDSLSPSTSPSLHDSPNPRDSPRPLVTFTSRPKRPTRHQVVPEILLDVNETTT